jgi:hypothetical protein
VKHGASIATNLISLNGAAGSSSASKLSQKNPNSGAPTIALKSKLGHATDLDRVDEKHQKSNPTRMHTIK